MMRLALLGAVALLLAPAALASERHPTLNELENEVMCPVCNTTLAQSNSDAAKAIEREIQDKIAAGWTKTQIKDFLIQQYGESILAAPPKHGIGLAAAVLGLAAWGWTRGRADPMPDGVQSSNGQGPTDPYFERRVDEELSRFE